MNISKEQLLSAGFVPTLYEGQDGEFMVMQRKIEEFPYAKEHLIDGGYLCEGMLAILEVSPAGLIQFYIPEADYLEGPVPLDSEEGLALFRESYRGSV